MGVTLLHVTHDRNEAARLADVIYRIQDGRIVRDEELHHFDRTDDVAGRVAQRRRPDLDEAILPVLACLAMQLLARLARLQRALCRITWSPLPVDGLKTMRRRWITIINLKGLACGLVDCRYAVFAVDDDNGVAKAVHQRLDGFLGFAESRAGFGEPILEFTVHGRRPLEAHCCVCSVRQQAFPRGVRARMLPVHRHKNNDQADGDHALHWVEFCRQEDQCQQGGRRKEQQE